MRKIIFLLLLFIIPLLLSAQFYGDGTSAIKAYYGKINSSNPMQTWNTTNFTGGVVYVGRSATGQYDLEIENTGTLNISSGITIKFCTTSSDLKITGTGVLNAVGSSTVPITFTKDVQATWGHISFEASTGSSTIQYCIIEWGSKTGSGIEGFGGGIHANTSSLSILDCTIQNNIAIYGGGIFVNKNQNPYITNCIIKNNTVTYGGGGLYFWNDSYSVITNCLIFNNSVTNTTQYGGGGILFGPSTGSVKVINCTFANNTAGFRANEIYFYLSPNARVINSILWGTNLPYYGATSTSFVNSAIQGGYPSGSVGCINLDSDNTTSPNFLATDGTDWSIKVISPCRDAGTTPNPAVPNDYDGILRVGVYDIGAYEVQYNGWKTTATDDHWTTAGNWTLLEPTSSQNVVIPTGASNYPTGSSSQNYTIGADYGMVLDPGAQATFGTLTTTGDLRLRSDASNISSLIINSTNVTAIVDIYLTGDRSSTTFKWHYISSPFYTLPSITPFTAVTYNLAQFIESYYADGTQAWVAYDGYNYATGMGDPEEFDVLSPGIGYNFYDNVDNEITISGQLTHDDVDVDLDFSDKGEDYSGFNLLGNPFSCGINWDVITASLSYPGNTSKAVFFTKDNVQYTYLNGVSVPPNATANIPPMQGFFVKTYSISNTLTIPLSAREHNSTARYKGSSIIPLVRLSITKDSLSDETVIRFDEQAESGLDYDFDALKMFLSGNKMSIYSCTGETKYVINGQPFPEDSMNISLAINSPKPDTLKITATQIQDLEDYGLILKDLDQDFNINLNEVNEYIFFADSGTVTDRFVLTVYNMATGLPDIFEPEQEKAFNIYSNRGILFINPANDEWNGESANLRIYDITGRIIKQQKNIEWYKGVTKEIPLSVAQGIYFVEIRAGGERYVGKVNAGY